VISILENTELLVPWEKCSAGLETELSREISKTHILYGVEAISIARRIDNDDVLFFLPKNKKPFAVVHLTYSYENSTYFPSTRLFSSLNEWIEECMKVDNEEYYLE
jgi:hypothetical protein